jgi:hypothetical protein
MKLLLLLSGPIAVGKSGVANALKLDRSMCSPDLLHKVGAMVRFDEWLPR